MNLFAISGLSVAIFGLILAFISLIYGKTKAHRILAFFNGAVFVWGLGLFIAGFSSTPSKAILGWKIAHLGGVPIGILFYHMVCVFCDLKRKKSIIIYYLIGLIFISTISMTNLVINKVRFAFNSIYINDATLLYLITVVIWLFIVSLSFYELLRFLPTTKGEKRTQTIYMISGFLIGFLGGISTFLPEFGIDVYPIGNFSIVIYCSIITYAILKHSFMDIRIAFSRIAVYSMILLLVIGIPIGFLFMNLFALAGLMVGIFCFILSFITLAIGKTKLHRLLMLFNIAVAFWGVGSFIAGIATKESIGILGWKIAHLGGFFIGTLFYHLVYVFCKISRKWTLYFAYAQAIFFNILNLFTNYLINETRFVFGIYYNKVTLMLLLGIICYVSLIVLSYFELTKFLRKSKGIQHTQTLYIIFGFLCGFLGGTSTFLPEFRIDIFYPFGNFGIVLYACIVTYAILKFRLLDINIALTRAGIFLFVYTVVLGLPFIFATIGKEILIALFGGRWWVAPLGLMAALATAGPFIYIYFQRKAEDKLLREQKRYQDSLKQASIGMTRIRDLHRLLDLIAHIVTKTVKISYAAIYLYNQETNEYVLQVSRDKGRMAIPKVDSDNPLIQWITVEREPLIYEEIKLQMEDTGNETYKHLEKNMRLLTASVIIPSFLEDKFIGFFVLGDKISGQIYTPDDLNVFQVLASQAALAIENAQFYADTQEMQKQIAQAEKMATIGTMADGLSHQINNRFYALSLIAGDTIDSIKMTDTSKCTPEVKKMIDSINHALDRIQTNVIQGGEVVKGILKYTRKGEEGFEPLTLDQVLDGTLEMVQYKVKLSEIDVIRNYPKDTPKIKVNRVQLQEAFFNFIDNAYDAIVERRTLLKEEGYRGRITVSAAPRDSKLEIVVEDNGIGIKNQDNKKVFTPFFTTKTSSQKGTGLGLYVVRRIITDTHRGKISFESSYKVGTRFILELPIAK